MRILAQIVSALALAGTILPPALYLLGSAELSGVQGWMLAATLGWFASAPLWMERGRG